MEELMSEHFATLRRIALEDNEQIMTIDRIGRALGVIAKQRKTVLPFKLVDEDKHLWSDPTGKRESPFRFDRQAEDEEIGRDAVREALDAVERVLTDHRRPWLEALVAGEPAKRP